MASGISPMPESRIWEQDARPQSQPLSSTRERRRGNRELTLTAKARQETPVVINSILDSFDIMRSPSIITTDEEPSMPMSGRSRPNTAGDAITNGWRFSPSSSPGFGVAFPMDRSTSYERGVKGARVPPAIITSKDGWALPVSSATKSPSFMSTKGHDRTRSSSLNSRSSFSTTRKDKNAAGKNKLSSADWVKQSPATPMSPPVDWPKEVDRSPLRKASDESLRPPKSRIEILTPLVTANISRAEQIIALSSTPKSASSKRRLYLNDTGSQEEHAIDGPEFIADRNLDPVRSASESILPRKLDDSVDSVVQQILADHIKQEEENKDDSLRRSPQRNSIVDSIPMRTSSLRQPSSSPARSKKKERKSKRKSEIGKMAKLKVGGQRDSFVSSISSRSIPDSSWNDLGEEDETVKRIMELREQRKARMLEPPRSPIRGLSPSAVSDTSTRRSSAQHSIKSDSALSSPRLRPEVNRSATEPSPLSQVEMRNEHSLSTPSPVFKQLDRRKTDEQSPIAQRHKSPIIFEKSPLRPFTAKSFASFDTPLALDYSYSDAVDALRDTHTPTRVDRPQSSSTTPVVNPIPVQISTSPAKPAVAATRSTSVSNRSKSFRWRGQNSDSPQGYDKSARHRSISMGNAALLMDPHRDSVEAAVSEYLRAERLSRKVKHPLTGRLISFSEVGDPEGTAVIICLGMGLTRYVSAFYDELASTLRLRLITIDRPGVGNSEPHPPNDKSGPLSWPDDVLAVCQHLGISKFSMLAHSAGAIYALATALILPHLIRGKLHLLSPWIPPSQLEAYSNPTTSDSPAGALPRSQRLLRVLPAPLFKAANASFMNATSTSLKPNGKGKSKTELRQSGPSTPPGSRPTSRGVFGAENNRRESMMLMDQFMPELNPTDNFPVPKTSASPKRSSTYISSPTTDPTDPSFEFASSGLSAAEHVEKERRQEYTALLTQRTWDLATRDSNPASDLLVCLERHRTIGFRYTDVHQQVIITHGSEDKRVPVANVKWLADQMNRHSVAFGGPGMGRGVDGLVMGGCEMRVLEGEGHGLMASPLIMGDILTEIAGYWRQGI